MINDELEVPMETEVETTAEVEKEPEVAAEAPESSAGAEENVSGEKAGHREYTPEERASYSFRKQLNKQKQKYENQYGELQHQYNELLQRLDRLENPDKYAPLNRGQFQDDDSYIDALVQQRFDSMWNTKLQEAQKRYQEQAQQNQEVQTYRTRQDDNVKKLFKTPEAEQEYRNAIHNALQNGLGDRLDEYPEIAKYIMRSDMGPKIMYQFATHPDEFEKMFNDNVTEMDQQFMIRELESRLRNEVNKPAVPVIGKPGMGTETKHGSIFDSDESILNYLRTH
jgi:uncharacterized coiled-coil DUF342 family protein